MKAIIIPAAHCRQLPFYLAAEEWAARCLSADDDYFFAWQVSPTVICGRHQDMPLEVDMGYAAAHGIEVWRRKSGGGCVYADNNNVMFSYITANEAEGVSGTFGRYTSMICDMLAGLGIKAGPTGRNDVAVDGRKVAGNAYYRTAGRSIVHGTMLYDADMETMSHVLTPSRAKLESKGVKSVPSRITTLHAQGLALSCDEFVRYAVSALCDNVPVVMTADDVTQTERIMQSYLTPEFLHRTPAGRTDAENRQRIDGAGEICVGLTLDSDGRIDRMRLTGDFFATGDIESGIIRALKGCRLNKNEVESVLRDTGELIRGVDASTLAAIIAGAAHRPTTEN
ncbi:MAG: lipoate protein ligase C-terminal domain-containing protein [Bacteroidales bacterium]|nr:lipoate protein ligase C-terminal domain-containing protein [Bacteroidales bacterium]